MGPKLLAMQWRAIALITDDGTESCNSAEMTVLKVVLQDW